MVVVFSGETPLCMCHPLGVDGVDTDERLAPDNLGRPRTGKHGWPCTWILLPWIPERESYFPVLEDFIEQHLVTPRLSRAPSQEMRTVVATQAGSVDPAFVCFPSSHVVDPVCFQSRWHRAADPTVPVWKNSPPSLPRAGPCTTSSSPTWSRAPSRPKRCRKYNP